MESMFFGCFNPISLSRTINELINRGFVSLVLVRAGTT
jgi:hypothetical protein